MRKTLRLIEHYERLLEQDLETDPSQQQVAPPEGSDMGVQDVTQPDPQQDEVPLTSQAEDDYIAMIVDAALFEPSQEDARTLLNLQSAIKLKKYTNSREDILPIVLGIINPSSSSGDIRKDLGKID